MATMYSKLLTSWTGFVISRPRQILTIIAIVTLAALYIGISRFSIDSDTEHLIRQDTNWKAVHQHFLNSFPQYANNTFVVVSGPKISAVTNTSKQLEHKLAAKPELFQIVYNPSSDPFLDEHALLFVDPDSLDNLASNLADAQPFLTAVANDPNLRGLFTLLAEALDSGENPGLSFSGIAELLAVNIDKTIDGAPTIVPWRDEMIGNSEEKTFYHIIFVQGRQNFGTRLPNEQILNEIRQSISELDPGIRQGVNIRLTGQVPLDHGEVLSAMSSAQLAGAIAAISLFFILVFGVGSIRIIAATYLAMAVGLVWTSAYAILAVGQYNTISIIFLVMFIGLGVDFAIHLSLRYQEELRHRDIHQALVCTNRDLGPAITLCGITSAIGFLSFVPTEYIGLAELGIISGGGMIIAVFVSLTVIPAFFEVVGRPTPMPTKTVITSISMGLNQYQKTIVAVTFSIALLSAYVAKDAYFDYSTLSLKDPGSEAMETFRDLQQQNVITDYAISYVAQNLDVAIQAKQKLLELPTVSDVKIPSDYVPPDQEDKLYILEDVQILLTETFFGNLNPAPYTPEERENSILTLLAACEDYLRKASEDPDLGNDTLLASVRHLRASLSRLVSQDDSTKEVFESSVIPPLLVEIDWLKRAINVGALEFDDLPANLKSRLVSPRGEMLVTITPSQDIVPVKAMRAFTGDVQQIVTGATGRLITELGVGDIVISAFTQAIALAVICIFIVLLFALRSLIDTLLVFIPLSITALVTLAFSVLVDMPLNMANVVVLPLIFGLGVDNGIHVVERFHESPDPDKLANSSTPRAVFLSTLTTLGTFGALAFSSHQGIYSIGVLLSCALAMLMLLTIVSLPALLSTFSTARSTRF